MARKMFYQISDADIKREFEGGGDDGLVTTEQAISGLGIENDEIDDEKNAAQLNELLNSFHSDRSAEDIEREQQERDAYAEQEAKHLQDIENDYNRKRYEAEQKAKAERLAKEAAEREEEEELEREEYENSFRGKLAGLFKKKDKKAEIVTEETEIQTDNTEIVTEPTTTEAEEVVAETVKTEVTKVTTKTEEPIVKTEPVKVKEKKEKPAKPAFTLPSFNFKKQPKTPVAVMEETTANNEPDWKYIATHDEATDMLNTRAYSVALKSVGNNCAVLFFDINNLKYVNDNFSHADGDDLIKTVATAIKDNFGNDYAFRIGGDEFIVIIPNGNTKKMQEEAGIKINKIHQAMQVAMKRTKKPYAVSIGYAVGDGKHPVSDIVKAADASMYKNKKAYKESHPEFDGRHEKQEVKQIPNSGKDHDELLSADQQKLKNKIQKQHSQPSQNSTTSIIREIQKKSGDVHAILIASPNFDYLYIICNVDEFVNMALTQSSAIDYSYLYVVWAGGPQYYGTDTYYNEVTNLFQEIAEGLMSGKFRSDKDIKSIKGINIFKKIYISGR